MGYHKAKIKKGKIGELSKVQEELDEAFDAEAQGVKLMLLLELSDVYLAIKRYLDKNFPGTTMKDLRKMAKRTESAFKSGKRK